MAYRRGGWEGGQDQAGFLDLAVLAPFAARAQLRYAARAQSCLDISAPGGEGGCFAIMASTSAASGFVSRNAIPTSFGFSAFFRPIMGWYQRRVAHAT